MPSKGMVRVLWVYWRRREMLRGLGIITEVMDAAELDIISEVADVVQVGAAICRISRC
jgi:3-deoxy-D-arabino-heptulosonate 7-phosphate (DAHP) synthase